MAVLKAVVYSHGLGSTGAGQREMPASTVSFPVEKQDISPPSLADRRVLIRDGRAISYKDSMDVIRSRVVIKLRKIDSRLLKRINAGSQSVAQVEPNFRLGQFVERMKACTKPR